MERRRRRTGAEIAGDREAARLAATLGAEVRSTRRRRHLTQRQLARRVGLEQSRLSEIELGTAVGTPLIVWVRLGIALGRPVGIAFARDLTPAPADAGHLDAQELVVRLVAPTRRRALVELPPRRGNPSHSVDVAIRDDAERLLMLLEIWNRVDDAGESIRSTDRKVSDAEGLAAAIGGARPYQVASCWLFTDTAANRALVARYPALLRARFPGSSRAWVEAIVTGAVPPREPGIAWIDVRTRRLIPLRWRR